eukprot:TRINITY_DN89521_c0_g1_i1.p1 TRINITY_DN89521_c0_g1~~TRINITY_DN89521_c0_g1_i1.p1  ORF type:complete len:352 (+),score=33.32 TRINITY_DN89521_c0_g1_i1:69-1058(+)
MGASVCSSVDTGPVACDVGSACGRRHAQRSYRNKRAAGLGGPITKASGHTACVVIAFDYEGYPAEELSGCSPLVSSVAHGRRFADLAGASRAEVLEFYDAPGIPGSLGFPTKGRTLEAFRRVGENMGPDDALVIFFAGHATQTRMESGGRLEDALCYVTQDGSADFLSEGEVLNLVCSCFHPQMRLLFVTETCHGSGSCCDLSNGELASRPICHISAVQDRCISSQREGAFAWLLFDTLERLARDGQAAVSVVDVFNECLEGSEEWQDECWQDLRFERTESVDPDMFAWPLVPPRGWEAPRVLTAPPRVLQRSCSRVPLAFRRSLKGGA